MRQCTTSEGTENLNFSWKYISWEDYDRYTQSPFIVHPSPFIQLHTLMKEQEKISCAEPFSSFVKILKISGHCSMSDFPKQEKHLSCRLKPLQAGKHTAWEGEPMRCRKFVHWSWGQFCFWRLIQVTADPSAECSTGGTWQLEWLYLSH